MSRGKQLSSEVLDTSNLRVVYMVWGKGIGDIGKRDRGKGKGVGVAIVYL